MRNSFINYRSVEVASIDCSGCLDLMFAVYNIPNAEFTRRLKIAIKLIEEVMGYRVFGISDLKILEDINFFDP